MTTCSLCPAPGSEPVTCPRCRGRKWLCDICAGARAAGGKPMREHLLALHAAICDGPKPSPALRQEVNDFAAGFFRTCVFECWDNPEFMREYRRLTGHAIGLDKRSAIERLIDQATGHEPKLVDDAEAVAFFNFVRDCVWLPALKKIAEEASRA